MKTALFLPLLAIGRLNRRLLERDPARLRRPVGVELAGLVAIIAAVGVLTDLRPGSEAPPAPKPVLHGTADSGSYSRVEGPAAGSTASR